MNWKFIKLKLRDDASEYNLYVDFFNSKISNYLIR